MRRIVGVVSMFAWNILVLVFTASKLLPENKILYFVVTIPLLIIPNWAIKRYVLYKK